MKRISFFMLFLALFTSSCQQSPQQVTNIVEITREIEVTREVEREVTRIVEVTRVVPEIMTVVVFPTDAPTAEPTSTIEPIAEPTQNSTALPETSRTGGSFQKYDSMDAISAFQAAGLEIGAIIPEVQDANSLRPNTWIEGNRFLIPSLGEDRGGRVLSFATPAELKIIEDYFTGFTGILASWVSVKDNLVLQVGADLPRDKWLQYEAVFQGMP